MKIIGITGSSGSGKTTLSEILNKKEEIDVIDCDKIARKISIPGNLYLETIKKELGEEFILEDGNLNRKKLAEAIYNNKEKLKKLNDITFKYVVDEVIKEINKIKENEKTRFIIIDAPLLLESNLSEKCDYVISVIADEKTKVERICKRDNISEDIAKKRLAIQKEDIFYIQNSDFVIENNDISELELKIEEILEKIEGK